jgi:hypothetical protein
VKFVSDCIGKKLKMLLQLEIRFCCWKTYVSIVKKKQEMLVS